MSTNPIKGLTIGLALWLAMEFGVMAWTLWKQRREDMAIRGAFDNHLPSHWKPEHVERVREDFLRMERKRQEAKR